MKKALPNILTLANLFCGCLGIFYMALIIKTSSLVTQRKAVLLVCLFILLCLIFDFADGMVARLLKVDSKIGKELDSLADMVSFGVLPGFIMMYLINHTLNSASFLNSYFPNGFIVQDSSISLGIVGLFIPIFSALRLAKFNLDQAQKDNFRGLPTPANTIFILSLALVKVFAPESFLALWTDNFWFLLFTTIVFCSLLISNLPMFSFKIKNLSFSENIHRYLLLTVALILIIFLKIVALPLIVIFYIVLSIIFGNKFI